jgi:hypothetical protein
MAKLKGIATGKVITVTPEEAAEILSHRALGFEVCSDDTPTETVTESPAQVPAEVEHLAAKILKSTKTQPNETGTENGGSGRTDKA